MAELLIGRTTHDSVRIWVRASDEIRDRIQTTDKAIAFVRVTPEGGPALPVKKRTLRADRDFTGRVEFSDLTPEHEHTCEVEFGKPGSADPDKREVPTYNQGRFKTFPEGSSESLDFLLGSCNTRYKKSDSSFLRLTDLAQAKDAAFMIHCGDQIYYPDRTEPDLEKYRNRYRKTWERGPVRTFLTQLPHYMILDDHEIRNNFRNDQNPLRLETQLFDTQSFKELGVRAYREYQHSHNPSSYPGRLYYRFSFGGIRFFVMDVRSERWETRGHMISPKQMTDFLAWLREFPKDLKFVVTGVPFVADVKEETSKAPGRDKWCARAYRAQRHRILEFLCEEKGLRPPVFLTGDMHNSYHARMRLRRGSDTVTLHELMSSPINQRPFSLGKHDRYILNRRSSGPRGWEYVVNFPHNQKVEQYFRDPNAMHIRVRGPKVLFGIYPTRKGAKKGPVRQGSFRV